MEKGLVHMINKINKKRQQLEEECNLLRDLLKPWPKKKHNPPKSTTLANAQVPQEKESEIGEQEKQAILKVEKLLEKAQITLQVKKTKAETSSVIPAYPEVDSTNSIEAKCTPKSFKQDNGHQTSGLDANQPSLKSLESHSKQKSGRVGQKSLACSQRSRSVDVASKTSARTSATDIAVKQNGKAQIKDRTAPKTVQLQGSGQQSHRSVRPGSGKSRHFPVHMSAPFKTEENLKMPGRKLMQSHICSKNSSSRSRPNSGIGSHSYRTLPAINNNKDMSSCQRQDSALTDLAEDNSGTRVSSPDSRLDTIVHDFSETNDELNTNRNCIESETASQIVSSSPQDRGINSVSVRVCHELLASSAAEQPEEEPFTLQRNGSTLRIPGKLSKLVRINNSLREQCSTAQLVKKVSPDDAGKQFIERLENSWEISEELWMRVRSMTCLRSHTFLLDMLRELKLPQLSGQSTYQELYRVKRTLEFVLSVFASLQQESDYLSQVQYRINDFDLSSPSDECAANTRSPSSSSQSECIFQNDEKSEALELGWDLDEYLRGSEEWAHLCFQQEYLHLQLWLMELINAEWWQSSVLSTLDFSVLQNVYSLLSTAGQFLPAFVSNKTN